MTTINEDDYLAHYGILRRSGRYPWGSGGSENVRAMSFLDHVAKLKAQGLSEQEIARGFSSPEHPFTTTMLREAKTIALAQKKAADVAFARRLQEKGYGNVEIGKRFDPPKNESSVRSLLKEGADRKADILKATSNMLRDQVDEKRFVDVGTGVENLPELGGISKERLNSALALLKDEGYQIHSIQVDQLGTSAGKKTTIKVLCPPGTEYKDVAANKDKIQGIRAVSEDGGLTYLGIKTPLGVSSKRIGINYAEDGGSKADGVIYVRPGVPDVALGGSRYAQVRIAVNGTHYLKGMAMYKDDLPEGVDLQFNTNKKKSELGPDKMAAMKPMQVDKDGNVDKDNPFGAAIRRQILDAKGEKPTSAMNIVNEEGDWDNWSRNLASQTLSKQSPRLAQTQLNVTYERKRAQLDEIMSLTNPAVRKKLLKAFADGADSSAVHLEAAALPRSSWHVLLPFKSMKENEVYAPNFHDGEQVALIRYPHGGTFEIPVLTVNNRNPTAKAALNRGGKPATDAIGIHHKVAERLSGADFDGDAVLVIPNNSGAIKSTPALEGLKGFDTQAAYPAYHGMKTIDGGVYNATTKKVEYGPKGPSPRGKGQQMGMVSNLITDMSIQKASSAELAAAVRHSMVVIDAEKHALNYKQSAIDNGIRNLQKKYQPREDGRAGGAATLISRATARQDVLARRPRPASKGGPVDKATGRKVFEDTGESWPVTTVDKRTGEVTTRIKFRTQESKKLAETDDAHTLSSGTLIEKVYADHSNKLKALANQARKEEVLTKTIPYSPSARKAYDPEVKSLTAKLNLAVQNRPLERQAQVIANATFAMKKASTPTMDEATVKKVKAQALVAARSRTGADKQMIKIEPNEWAAIQAGAITNERLKNILDNADLETIKKLATPKSQLLMSSSKLARASAMAQLGYTQAEIASQLGVSLTTLKEGLKNG